MPEVFILDRQRAGSAVHDGMRQPRRACQHMIGIEVCRLELRAMEGRGAGTLAQPPVRDQRRRAICQPPATMPSNSMNGTAPTEGLLASLP